MVRSAAFTGLMAIVVMGQIDPALNPGGDGATDDAKVAAERAYKLAHPGALLKDPIIEAMPSQADVLKAYPVRAQRLGKTGVVFYRCKVSPNGGLDGCEVLIEDPAGYGFGDAALNIASQIKLNPLTRSGKSVAGLTWQNTVVFRLDNAQPE